MSEVYVYFITTGNLNEAKKIARVLVEEKIAACVNIVQNIISIYEWKGNIEEDNEFLLILKTNGVKGELLEKRIKKLHSYEVPECIGFKIEKGSEKYLKWVNDVLSS
ncbi:MAG: divalent-cation tolerance protein CutA [Promethearchaeota archaeon]